MLLLNPAQLHELRPCFLPDRPGPLIGLHVLQTGNGACYVDRWPDPRAILADTAGNYALLGRPDVLSPDDLRPRINGFVEAPEDWLPLLHAAFPSVQPWERVMLRLEDEPRHQPSADAVIRPLEPYDAYHVWGLSPESAWITKTWGGPAGLVASGMAWGAFVEGILASVATTFFVGDRYEEIGIVTEPGYRGRGLSAACTAALVRAIRARGRSASWTTSTDNAASLRVAEKLGFRHERRDRLYVIGIAIPAPAS